MVKKLIFKENNRKIDSISIETDDDAKAAIKRWKMKGLI